jgi:hypothetical protein
MDFDRFEAMQLKRHDLASRCLLNMAAECRRVEAMEQPRRETDRLKFPLKGFVQPAESLGDLQGVVFFSP